MNLLEHWDKALYAVLGVATYLGTFRNNSGIPLIYNRIKGRNYGLVLGIVNKIEEGSHIVGCVVGNTTLNSGRIDGVNLNLGSVANGREEEPASVNGLEASVLYNISANAVAKEIPPVRLNGVQIGLVGNKARPGRHGAFQIGTFNSLSYEDGTSKIGWGLNMGETRETRVTPQVTQA